ncbi:histidine kinase [Novosphingobium sp.]|uniref:sensor histidine kinase n=1 Tax=Novosphingobium sp. TaxID=1874826 RepID=UPI0025D06E99|nr:histidine kinase [Novosphingobium sp.]MCC6926151.1 histidine kinase [Novosphingobium sp.]
MTNAAHADTVSPVSRPWAPLLGKDFKDGLGETTLRLGALFWGLVLIVDSVMWGIAGVDPADSFVGKVILNSFGVLLSVVQTAILYRFHHVSVLAKTVLAFVLSAIAAPIYGLFDLAIYRWCVWPRVPAFDLGAFGVTMVSSTAMFFGWCCLYVALAYSFDVRDRERKLAAAREEAIGAQVRALHYQINPHFLFNTLNSIAGLVEEGANSRAERMVLSLSTFLRTTLELDPHQDVPLGDELALQQDYLEIERERFCDRMGYSIEADPAVRQALVPSLILQPLVENAIKHGVGRSALPVCIRILARRTSDRLWIAVENDLGQQSPPLPGFGIGLRNVSERIASRFGQNGSFRAGIVDGVTYRVELDLPWRT